MSRTRRRCSWALARARSARAGRCWTRSPTARSRTTWTGCRATWRRSACTTTSSGCWTSTARARRSTITISCVSTRHFPPTTLIILIPPHSYSSQHTYTRLTKPIIPLPHSYYSATLIDPTTFILSHHTQLPHQTHTLPTRPIFLHHTHTPSATFILLPTHLYSPHHTLIPLPHSYSSATLIYPTTFILSHHTQLPRQTHTPPPYSYSPQNTHTFPTNTLTPFSPLQYILQFLLFTSLPSVGRHTIIIGVQFFFLADNKLINKIIGFDIN